MELRSIPFEEGGNDTNMSPQSEMGPYGEMDTDCESGIKC